MRKVLLILTIMLGFSVAASAQSPLLDGNQFTIQIYLDKEKDSVDTLYFENGGLRFATQKKYGFGMESYKAKEKNGTISFEAVYKSKKSGTMIYLGKVKDETIEGTLMWEMNLQNPVNYTFSKKEEIK